MTSASRVLVAYFFDMIPVILLVGLRGSMGAGFNHLNDLVIIETTQGLAKYLLKTIADIKDTGVVIGFDNRHNSLRYSEELGLNR